jgi:hypothetical protein
VQRPASFLDVMRRIVTCSCVVVSTLNCTYIVHRLLLHRQLRCCRLCHTAQYIRYDVATPECSTASHMTQGVASPVVQQEVAVPEVVVQA